MYASFGRLLSLLNIAASVLTLGLLVLIGIDVIGRWLFGHPLRGVPELTKLGIVAIVWLQIGYTLHIRKHLRADSLLHIMPRAGKRAVALLNAVLGMLMLGVVAYAGYFEFIRSWTNGVCEGEYPVRVPVWPIWGLLVLGAALTAAEYAIQAFQAAGFGTFTDDSEFEA
jgi:TRAP-type C4-dicarboxylate transport system permease small subunit